MRICCSHRVTYICVCVCVCVTPQNCFDVLCAALMPPEAKIAFVSAEGVELMYLMLASKKQSRYGALRLLDFAMTRCAPSCEKLVDLVSGNHFACVRVCVCV